MITRTTLDAVQSQALIGMFFFFLIINMTTMNHMMNDHHTLGQGLRDGWVGARDMLHLVSFSYIFYLFITD